MSSDYDKLPRLRSELRFNSKDIDAACEGAVAVAQQGHIVVSTWERIGARLLCGWYRSIVSNFSDQISTQSKDPYRAFGR